MLKLGTPESEITESDIAFWRGVFETHSSGMNRQFMTLR